VLASILITGSNREKRWQKAWQLVENFLGQKAINNPDFHLLDETTSIKISQIRELQKELFLKPFSSLLKVALINEAEKMTIPAQNSLLKILEEPPANSRIILTAQSKKMLLPTIVSRCHLIRLGEENHFPEESVLNPQLIFLKKMAVSSVGERILMAEKFSQTPQQALDFCQSQLITLRTLMRQQILSPVADPKKAFNPLKMARICRHLQKSLTLLKGNINPRLLIENLLISYSF